MCSCKTPHLPGSLHSHTGHVPLASAPSCNNFVTALQGQTRGATGEAPTSVPWSRVIRSAKRFADAEVQAKTAVYIAGLQQQPSS